MESFKASVQYNDWKGTAAADNADQGAITKFLKEQGTLKDDEFLLAVSFYSSEGFIRMKAYCGEGMDRFETVQAWLKATKGQLPVREIDIDLSVEKFLAMFKIFNVELYWGDLDLENREYSTER
jgi:hypothetical protein